MYTRCFERTSYNSYVNREVYEVINLSEYGFEWYADNILVHSGLIEDIDETIASLIEEGFNEVM